MQTPKKPVLVVGATGLLGCNIVRLLRDAGRSVRAVVRPGASEEKRRELEACGAELVPADLKDVDSLRAVCREASAVISTASATVSRREGDSIETVDRLGQLALVEAAEEAGVGHFVFVSFPPSDIDYALQRAKRGVEERLRSSRRLTWTILQPVNFTEVWLSPMLGFDPVGGSVRVFGTGRERMSWISVADVARFSAAAAETEALAGKTLVLGGPDPLSPLNVVEIFRELGAPECTIEHVPESALEAQLKGATNELEEAYAAIMLTTARGHAVDMRPALELLPGKLRTVREYAAAWLQRVGVRPQYHETREN
ncbi:MAG: SDR family oxidoreductase [Pseudomonadota bacterium]